MHRSPGDREPANGRLLAARRGERQDMVRRQIAARGVRDARVLEAMGAVPRELFVDPAWADEAYADRALPIGRGQTISQPYTVAFMMAALELTGTERVLEVGAGSGYAAAVLAHLARSVCAVERIAALAEEARLRLVQLGCTNVELAFGDGGEGWPQRAPFDAILVSAATDRVPPALREQLADGGRLVLPLGRAGWQEMTRLTKLGRNWSCESLGAFGFVPLRSGVDGSREEDAARR